MNDESEMKAAGARRRLRGPRFFGRLAPQERISEPELARGVRAIVADGVTSQIMASLVSGTFLAAFALRAGATNATIGLLAAIGPAAQLLQLPLIPLITRWRRRKAPVVAGVLAGRLVWLAIAAIPFVLPPPLRVPALVLGVVLTSVCNTLAVAAWNPWLRDVLPEHLLGPALARRMAYGTAAAAVVGLGAAVAVEQWRDAAANPLALYSGIFAAGTLVGLAGVASIVRIPEPIMPHAPPRPLKDVFRLPFRDRRYRAVMRFLAAWNVCVSLATPFIAVYMLSRLEIPLGLVVAFSVLSQLVHAAVLQRWGRIGERFSTTAVLGASISLFLLGLVAWPVAWLMGAGAGRLALVAAIHLVMGLANAGIAYGTGTIALQRAPRGADATAYLATNAVVSGIAAATAPVLAGAAVDWLNRQRLRVTVDWLPAGAPEDAARLVPVDLRGLDFVFLVAFAVGLYALHRLTMIRQRGEEVERKVVLAAFSAEVASATRNVTSTVGLSTVAGVRQAFAFPFSMLGLLFPERRARRRAAARGVPWE